MKESAHLAGIPQFVEEMGLYFDHWGLPRMAGRILGWLLICDPPRQSAGEIAEALHASKGSISTATRLLIEYGLIERTALPGERRDYFRIASDAWARALDQEMRATMAFRELAERGLALLDDPNGERGERLRAIRDLYTYYDRLILTLLAEWRREHGEET